MKLHFPGGKELSNAANGAFGMQITDDADSSRIAEVVDGNAATAQQVRLAASQWRQASVSDYARPNKRTYVDKASGVAYKRVAGAPLLSIGSDALREVACFIVENGEIVVLRRADYDPALRIHHGGVIGVQIPTIGEGSPLL